MLIRTCIQRISCLAFFLLLISACPLETAKKVPVQQGSELQENRFLKLARLKADRKLSAEERAKMEQLITILQDKDASKIPIELPNPLYKKSRIKRRRGEAAKLLGLEIAHRDAIPALTAVIKDKKEDTIVRYCAITGLSIIADKSVIPVLLDMLNDDKVDLRSHAYGQLDKLRVAPQEKEPEIILPVARYFGYSFYYPPAKRLEAIRKWKAWWKANKKRFKIVRERAMWER